MSRYKWLKAFNPILLVIALSQATTGFVILGTGSAAVGYVHIGIGCLLVAGILLHLAMNWSWIAMSYFRKKEAPPEIGVKAA